MSPFFFTFDSTYITQMGLNFRIFSCLLFLIPLTSYSQKSVFPQPESYKAESGFLQLEREVKVYLTENESIIPIINEQYKQLNSLKFISTNNSKIATISCKKTSNLKAESYEISVRCRNIEIHYTVYEGLF